MAWDNFFVALKRDRGTFRIVEQTSGVVDLGRLRSDGLLHDVSEQPCVYRDQGAILSVQQFLAYAETERTIAWAKARMADAEFILINQAEYETGDPD